MKRKSTRKAPPAQKRIAKRGDGFDVSLEDRIRIFLRKLGKKHVEVSVHNAFVELTGDLPTYRQKERLHRFVMSLPGVRAVKDQVEVEPPETVADSEIATHVRQALDAHAELPRGTVVAHVHAGTVRLQGHVRTAEERFIAEQVASHCRGVARVVNSLTVDPLDEITDEAAARAVCGALAYCEDFETDGITVGCADGRVTLRGEVPTLLDRALAEEVARIQAGVRRVENLIRVRASAAANAVE